jgi:hypothetical protein
VKRAAHTYTQRATALSQDAPTNHKKAATQDACHHVDIFLFDMLHLTSAPDASDMRPLASLHRTPIQGHSRPRFFFAACTHLIAAALAWPSLANLQFFP